jgi:hypothetical protein
MQESKETGWDGETTVDETPPDRESPAHPADSAGEDGWQQYRRWISKAPAPRTRRSGIDPSLYTWKGYRSWAKQVKRNWSDS